MEICIYIYLFSCSVMFNFFAIVMNQMYFPANKSVVEIKYCIQTPKTPPIMPNRMSTFVVVNEVASGRTIAIVGRRM